MEMLKQYDWPGNVRELINAIEISVTTAQFETELVPFYLPANIRAQIARSKIDQAELMPQKKSYDRA